MTLAIAMVYIIWKVLFSGCEQKQTILLVGKWNEHNVLYYKYF